MTILEVHHALAHPSEELRNDGEVRVVVAHKPSDLFGVGAAGSQEVAIAKDLMALGGGAAGTALPVLLEGEPGRECRTAGSTMLIAERRQVAARHATSTTAAGSGMRPCLAIVSPAPVTANASARCHHRDRRLVPGATGASCVVTTIAERSADGRHVDVGGEALILAPDRRRLATRLG